MCHGFGFKFFCVFLLFAFFGTFLSWDSLLWSFLWLLNPIFLFSRPEITFSSLMLSVFSLMSSSLRFVNSLWMKSFVIISSSSSAWSTILDYFVNKGRKDMKETSKRLWWNKKQKTRKNNEIKVVAEIYYEISFTIISLSSSDKFLLVHKLSVKIGYL